jgi:putative salt-induced outer membrane protein YdiY
MSIPRCAISLLYWYLGLLLLVLGLTAASVHAQEEYSDEVVVRGTTLRGRVVAIESEGVRFETIYGEGPILIPFDRLEAVRAEGDFNVRYDKSKETRGRIWGIEDLHLVVGYDLSSAERIPVTSIQSGTLVRDYKASFIQRLRARYPYWKGSLDVGYKHESGAVDTREIEAGVNVERRKEPTRLLFDLYYAHETTKSADKPEVTSKNESRALLLGELDLGKKFFLFALPASERDIPRGIKIRVFPSGGIGYRFVESKKALLQLQLGIGYVYESFVDFGRNDYVCGHVGVEGRYDFWRGVTLSGRIMYLPGLRDPSEDWLSRAEIVFTVPVVDPIALKIKLTEVYDNNPAPDVGNNKFTTSVGLALKF